MKKLVVGVIILSMLLFSINIVNAATGSATISSSKTSVKPGDTFTVTLSAKSEEGINGIDTTYSYDEDKLELLSAKVANDNWSNLGKAGTIQVIIVDGTIKADDIFVLTFKVKDNATVGTTAKVNTSEIKIDTDAKQNNKVTESAKTVSINISSESLNKPSNNNSNNNNSGNTSGNSSNNNNSNNSNNNSNSNSNNNNSNNSNSGNNSGNINEGKQNLNTSNTIDKNVSNTDLPKTGLKNQMPIILIIFASICSLIFYVKMKKNC